MSLNFPGLPNIFKHADENITANRIVNKLILVGKITGTFNSATEYFMNVDGSSAGLESNDDRYVVKNKKIRLLSAKYYWTKNAFTDLGANYMDVYLYTGSTEAGGIGGGNYVALATGIAFNGSLTNGNIDNIGHPTLTQGQIVGWAMATTGMGGTAKGISILSEWEILEE